MPRSCSIASCRNIDAMTDLSNRIIDHYERQAADWDRDRQNAAWNDKPWHDRFHRKPCGGAAVLDLAPAAFSPVSPFAARTTLRLSNERSELNAPERLGTG
jgi:hypothetical protein